MKKERQRERETEGQRDRERSSRYRLLFAARLSVSLSLCLAVSLPFSTTAHKYHFSFTQLEYNAKEKTVEFTLRVFADDLAAALSQQTGKSIKLEHKDAAPLVADYVRAKLALKSHAGRLRKLTWIGLELQADVALLYLEASLPEGLAGWQLRQQMFFDLFADQVNQVFVKVDYHQTRLTFKAGDDFKTLALTPQ